MRRSWRRARTCGATARETRRHAGLRCVPADESPRFHGCARRGTSCAHANSMKAHRLSCAPLEPHMPSLEHHDTIRAIVWNDGVLRLLDQRRLPFVEAWLECRSADDVAAAIRDLVVRGAPAIGIAAAWGVVLAARQ